MKVCANRFWQVPMLLLVLSCIFSVVAESTVSQTHTVDAFSNKNSFVRSSLISAHVRDISNLNGSSKHTAAKKQRMHGKRKTKKIRRRNRRRRANMKSRKRRAPDESRNSPNKDGPPIPAESENQFTFTSPNSRGLVIQVKPFVRSRSIAGTLRSTESYKVYVLEGLNIRHYRVEFPSGRQSIATFGVRQRVANCIRRKYLRRCINLPLRKKGSCTTRIVKKCVPGFSLFEIASTATRGTSRSNPTPSPMATPDILLDITAEV